jgi:hypothetical protein
MSVTKNFSHLSQSMIPVFGWGISVLWNVGGGVQRLNCPFLFKLLCNTFVPRGNLHFHTIMFKDLTTSSQVLTSCITCLKTLNFCPRVVFIYFIWFSEQRAVMSRFSTNQLIFTVQAVCVLWSVNRGFKMQRCSASVVKRLTPCLDPINRGDI